MSTVVLSGESFARIMKVCGANVEQSHWNEVLRYIYLEVRADYTTAWGENGISAAYTKEPTINLCEPCEMLIPVVKVPKGVREVVIEKNETAVNIEYTYADPNKPNTGVICTIPVESHYPNIKPHFRRDKPVYTIGFSPKSLIKVLKGFEKYDTLYFQFFGVHETVLINPYDDTVVNKDYGAIICPTRTKQIKTI